MERKRRKLAAQYDAERAANGGGVAQVSSIFDGVTIYVNGYTTPSAMTLRRYMLQHGGRYEFQLHRSSVTHIIATTLPDAKIKFGPASDVIVHPQWIVDSIAAGKQLAVERYLLFANAYKSMAGQQSLAESLGLATAAGESLAIAPELDRRTTAGDALTRRAAGAAGAADVEQAHPDLDGLGMRRSKDEPIDPGLARLTTLGGGDFVQKFYSNSRLHFISTSRMASQEFLRKALAERYSTSQPLAREAGARQVIFHVDMDCFFASVALRDRPHLANAPVVVAHALNGSVESKSDIACASYAARARGISNGMFMGAARRKVPDLVVVPYEFDKYAAVSKALYRVFVAFSDKVQAVSVDEAYLDMTGLGQPAELASEMRAQIHELSGCTASIGAGPNMLLARIATSLAKPDGFRFLSHEHATFEIDALPLRKLPGVGYKTVRKLAKAGITSCAECRAQPRARLQALLGGSVGAKLYDTVRGLDSGTVTLPGPRKSIGTEISWGVRFTDATGAEQFVRELAGEVGRRAVEAAMVGATLTLKIKQRHPDAPAEASKFLGHGKVNSFSRSTTLAPPSSDAVALADAALTLYRGLGFEATTVRGVGIALTRLSEVESERRPALQPAAIDSQTTLSAEWHPPAVTGVGGRGAEGTVELPTFSQLDPSVIAELPAETRRELEIVYRRRLAERKRDAGRGTLTQMARPTLPSRPASAAKTKPAPMVIVLDGASGSDDDDFVSPPPQTRGSSDEGSGRDDGVDPEFLAALPSQLRREVEADLKRTSPRKSGRCDGGRKRQRGGAPSLSQIFHPSQAEGGRAARRRHLLSG
ncbi:DNA repair protein REV1 [Thecamonas trahens ATCC 50062]|uniref:DNA repair protein REV1 n=1 Tax=Thecamonas trahens ATCC 50062 TaxID=461836 RepID=A0A0L0D8Z1_THETB|nr:DNA repair protein REV1 [Thecamonas trahens ATCC 50062]KNC48536.1 DNA repair protein REV1 [Thecamonas trahens ATCC 50062]|eukprot:XP_013758643.1 DNA repair protein REV1 [Thecamonas trahens ATCC 50062]